MTMFSMSTISCLTFLILLGCLPLVTGQYHIASIIASKIDSNYPLMARSNALQKKTVLLKSGNVLKTPLCVRKDAEYTISGVRYSNDGDEDVISIWFNSTRIGNFTSISSSNQGRSWDVFHTSGQFGKSMNLIAGTYLFELRVESADTYGIEIDAILFQTTDMTVGGDILRCMLHCLPSHRPDDIILNSTATPMQIVQRSFPTNCSEQDNIDVALFRDYITRYRITATYPKYDMSMNTRDAIFENCEKLSPQLLWRLKEKTFDLAQKVKTNLLSFKLNLVKEKPLIINITFKLKGKDDGLINSDIGSFLKVQFQNVCHRFDISCRYINRDGDFSEPTQIVITKEQQSFKYSIPDYSWTEHEINTIQLTLNTSLDQDLKIDTMELSRRDESGQTSTNIYGNRNILIEGRNVDFWWRRPRTMTVKTQNKTFQNIDFIIIYKRIPSTSRYNQILVLYQDSNFRILPLPPKHIDWTPFGSSMIIGQSDISSFRPFADISLIDIVSIEDDIIQMRLKYFEGGSALIKLSTGNLKTVLDVSELHFEKSLKNYPFARFRSMWVIDGNCDVDSMRVNGGQNIEILKPWKKLNGTIVEFFRMCQSAHLNLSPDIMLQVLN